MTCVNDALNPVRGQPIACGHATTDRESAPVRGHHHVRGRGAVCGHTSVSEGQPNSLSTVLHWKKRKCIMEYVSYLQNYKSSSSEHCY